MHEYYSHCPINSVSNKQSSVESSIIVHIDFVSVNVLENDSFTCYILHILKALIFTRRLNVYFPFPPFY